MEMLSMCGGIVAMKMEESKEIRQWIRILGIAKEFNRAVNDSHIKGQIECVMAGNHTVEGDEFTLDIGFLFRMDIAAGSIVQGHGLFLLSHGAFRKKVCIQLIKKLAMMIATGEEEAEDET